jgi:hypothetical protein
LSFVVIQVVAVHYTKAARGDLPIGFDLPKFDLQEAGAIHTVRCDEDDGFAPIDKLVPIESLPAIAGRATLRATDGGVAVHIARSKHGLFARARNFTLAEGEWACHIYNGRHKGVEKWNEQVTVSIAVVGGFTADRSLFRGEPTRLIDQRVKLK